jgi:GNAT superfamily N-acetyltransferase
VPSALGPDGIWLRPATAFDVVELATLKRRVERRCYGHLGTPEALSVRLHRRCTAWYLLGRLSAGELLMVAEHEERLVGLGAARVDRAGEPGSRMAGPRLHLHSTYVEWPGRGIGRALTRARLAAAERLGLRTVTADCLVGAEAAARRLRALGLVEVGERTPSPTFPGVGLSHWAGNLHTALERVDR